MENLTRPPKERLKLWLRVYFILSFITLIWTISSFFLAQTRLDSSWNLGAAATVFFGAASVALFAFSIFFGVLAVVGWQAIERTIERAVSKSFDISTRVVEEATDKVSVATNEKLASLERELRNKIQLLESDLRTKIENLQDESRGRVFSGLGYMLGEMSIGQDPLRPQNKEKLENAVELCREGYELLKKVGGPAEFNGLNNLVYYSSAYGKDIDRDFFLEKARSLKEAGKMHNASNLLLTACRAILQYDTKPEEVQEARAILTYLVEAPGPDKQKKEAKLYLASFPETAEGQA